jgi:hypothetical protein
LPRYVFLDVGAFAHFVAAFIVGVSNVKTLNYYEMILNTVKHDLGQTRRFQVRVVAPLAPSSATDRHARPRLQGA